MQNRQIVLVQHRDPGQIGDARDIACRHPRLGQPLPDLAAVFGPVAHRTRRELVLCGAPVRGRLAVGIVERAVRAAGRVGGLAAHDSQRFLRR